MRHYQPLRGLLSCLSLLAYGCANSGQDLEQLAKLLSERNFTAACSSSRKLLETETISSGKQAMAVTLFVECMRRSGRLNEAKKVLRSLPRRGVAIFGQALVDLAIDPGRVDQSVAMLDQSSEMLPEESEIPLRAGLILLANNQSKAAVVRLRRACQIKPSARCLSALAHGLLDLNLSDEALETARQILLFSPGKKDIARGRALIARLQKRNASNLGQPPSDWKEAENQLHGSNNPARALELLNAPQSRRPRVPRWHTLIGLCHLRLGSLARAISSLRAAARLDALDARNHYYLALAYRTAGRQGQEIEAYRNALKIDPFFTRAAQGLGELLLRTESFSEAAEIMDRAALLSPSILSFRMAARAHLKAGNLQQARTRYKSVVDLEPRDFEANLRIATIIWRQCRMKPSKSCLEDMKIARSRARLAAEIRPRDEETKAIIDDLSSP